MRSCFCLQLVAYKALEGLRVQLTVAVAQRLCVCVRARAHGRGSWFRKGYVVLVPPPCLPLVFLNMQYCMLAVYSHKRIYICVCI